MEEYKSNSNRSKELTRIDPPEEKRVEAVATGKIKKKSGFRKITDLIIQDDVENVKSYILMDVVVPSIKKAIADTVKDGIDMLIYGSPRGSSSNSGYTYRRDYRRMSEERVSTPRARYQNGSFFDFDDIVFPTRTAAENVLIKLDEMIDEYKIASVADFYEIAGIHDYSQWTYNKFGWTDIGTAKIVRSYDGWVIKMPKALPLD